MNQEVSTSSISRTVNATTLVENRAISRKAILRRVVAWAFLGLAWGAAMRAWMTLLALEFGDRPQFTFEGTFGAILLPATLIGAIQGWAASAAETSDRKQWRWAILSPLLLVIGPLVFLEGFISALVTNGLGGGAIAVALIGMLGGYAFSGFGVSWLRWISGFLALSLTFASAYGIYFADSTLVTTPNISEAFGALLYVLLMVLLLAGVSAPSRYQSKQHISV